MAGRLYKPGSKRTPTTYGKITKNRYAWLRTAIAQFIIMRYEPKDAETEEEEDPDRPDWAEAGTTYVLLIPQPGRKPVALNITALTMVELNKTRQLFNLLFDKAEPVIRERDQVARDAFTKGDDSFNRLYREVPTLIIREGEERSNLEGVQYGPTGVPDGSGTSGDLAGGVRGSRDELADVQPPEDRSQDDGATTD